MKTGPYEMLGGQELTPGNLLDCILETLRRPAELRRLLADVGPEHFPRIDAFLCEAAATLGASMYAVACEAGEEKAT